MGDPGWLSALVLKARRAGGEEAAAEVIRKVAGREISKRRTPPEEICDYIADDLDVLTTTPAKKGRKKTEKEARNIISTAIVSTLIDGGLTRLEAGRAAYGWLHKMRVQVGGLDNFQGIVRRRLARKEKASFD